MPQTTPFGITLSDLIAKVMPVAVAMVLFLQTVGVDAAFIPPWLGTFDAVGLALLGLGLLLYGEMINVTRLFLVPVPPSFHRLFPERRSGRPGWLDPLAGVIAPIIWEGGPWSRREELSEVERQFKMSFELQYSWLTAVPTSADRYTVLTSYVEPRMSDRTRYFRVLYQFGVNGVIALFWFLLPLVVTFVLSLLGEGFTVFDTEVGLWLVEAIPIFGLGLIVFGFLTTFLERAYVHSLLLDYAIARTEQSEDAHRGVL